MFGRVLLFYFWIVLLRALLCMHTATSNVEHFVQLWSYLLEFFYGRMLRCLADEIDFYSFAMLFWSAINL